MKVEMTSPDGRTYKTESVEGQLTIESSILRPDNDWIKEKTKETGCPIFPLYLPGSEVMTSLVLTNGENGKTSDLGSYLFTFVDVIKISEADALDCEGFQSESNLPLNEESLSWMMLLSNRCSSMPRAKAINVCNIGGVHGLAAMLHEAMHVKHGHVEDHNGNTFDGARQLIMDENEASTQALAELSRIIIDLGLDEKTITSAKRFLDVLYYSYVIGFEAVYGAGVFSEIRELDLSPEEKALVREIFFWLVDKYM